MAKRKRVPAKYQPGFLARMDGRLEKAKVLSTAFYEICDDQGGLENLSHTKLALIERFCFLEYQLRRLEKKLLLAPKKNDHLI